MRVLFLADINSIHTQRWAIALKNRGAHIGVFSLNPVYSGNPDLDGIQVFCPTHFNRDLSHKGLFAKLKYLTLVTAVRRCISSFIPDIVHAHYASSYGILGSLSRFHPFILSVWGSDVFDFPKRSFLTRLLLRYNFRNADQILSTSHVMAREIGKYSRKKILITPFGIDTTLFKPNKTGQPSMSDSIIIGTTKALEPEYGIEYLIRAFGHLHEKHPDLSLKLVIAGGGSLEQDLRNLVVSLKLEKEVIFAGKIPHDAIPAFLNQLDIYAALSISESFGVSIIEASACELPVVVSSAGGLKEVVEDGVTGLLVKPENPRETMTALEKLLINEDLRREMGRNGRKRVEKIYNWTDNVDEMLKIYQHFL